MTTCSILRLPARIPAVDSSREGIVRRAGNRKTLYVLKIKIGAGTTHLAGS